MDMFGFDPPPMDGAAAVALVAHHWGVAGTPTRIRGERSTNTVIAAPGGERFVLQVQSASERSDVVDLQTRAMQHISEHDPSIPIPHVVPTNDGAHLATVEVDGTEHLARLVTYLPGETFDDGEPLTRAAYEAIGELIGRLATALADFEHPAADHAMPWDLANGLIVDPAMRADISPRSARALTAVDDRLRAVAEIIPTLPHQTVHNDGHAGNLIRADESSHLVTGVIDFGDVVRTAVAADVAIIGESFAPAADQPGDVLAAIVTGYHRRRPLDDVEVEAIPDLVLARTALNVLLVEYQLRHAPHLEAHAGATRAWTIERLGRWQALDRAALVADIRSELERA